MIRAYSLDNDGMHPVIFDSSKTYTCISYSLLLKLRGMTGESYQNTKQTFGLLVGGKTTQVVPIYTSGEQHCACLYNKPCIPNEVLQGGVNCGYDNSV